jgi:hypothetical protein
VLRLLHGQEVNGIYDGYSFLPMYLGGSNSTSFAHLHDYEPHPWNHYVPHHGIFSKFYFGRMLKSFESNSKKYASYKKNQGPPFYSFVKEFDALENNEYLQQHQIPLESVIHEAARTRIARGEEHPVLCHHDH